MYQCLFGAEMIVDGGQIHPGAARDLAQRGRVKALLSKQAFSGVEDLVAGVYRQFKRSIETSVLNATPCGSVWQADIVPEKSDRSEERRVGKECRNRRRANSHIERKRA